MKRWWLQDILLKNDWLLLCKKNAIWAISFDWICYILPTPHVYPKRRLPPSPNRHLPPSPNKTSIPPSPQSPHQSDQQFFFLLCCSREICTIVFVEVQHGLKLANQYSVTVSAVNLVKIFEASFILNFIVHCYLQFKIFCLDPAIESKQIFLNVLCELNSLYILDFFTKIFYMELFHQI